MAMKEEYIPLNWDTKGSIIKVIGVGGGGNNAVNNMYRMGIEGVDFVVCNTDGQALLSSPIPIKIQLGSLLTKGRGAGCNPEQGRQAALESLDAIENLLGNTTEMVFITAGMGGGTGTGAAPVIAKTAKELGLLTVAIVTLPFRDEGRDFMNRAREGIIEMQRYVDSLLVVDNQRLYEIYGELPILKAFAKVDDVLTTAAKGIAEIITRPGYINVDFADVRKVMESSGVAIMGSGSAAGDGRALLAVEQALSSPLLNNSDISGAKNVLVNITASEDILMSELNQIMDYVQESTGGRSEFIKRGVVFDNSLGDMINVTVVATGFGVQAIPEMMLKNSEPVKKEILKDTDNRYAEEKDNFTFGSLRIKEETKADEELAFTVTDNKRVFEVDEVEADTPATPYGAKLKRKPALIMDREDDIIHLEDTPAYVRRNMAINATETESDTAASLKLTKASTGEHRLNTNNSYLHQTMD
jgi:cell division protein FtsZ